MKIKTKAALLCLASALCACTPKVMSTSQSTSGAAAVDPVVQEYLKSIYAAQNQPGFPAKVDLTGASIPQLDAFVSQLGNTRLLEGVAREMVLAMHIEDLQVDPSVRLASFFKTSYPDALVYLFRKAPDSTAALSLLAKNVAQFKDEVLAARFARPATEAFFGSFEAPGKNMFVEALSHPDKNIRMTAVKLMAAFDEQKRYATSFWEGRDLVYAMLLRGDLSDSLDGQRLALQFFGKDSAQAPAVYRALLKSPDSTIQGAAFKKLAAAYDGSADDLSALTTYLQNVSLPPELFPPGWKGEPTPSQKFLADLYGSNKDIFVEFVAKPSSYNVTKGETEALRVAVKSFADAPSVDSFKIIFSNAGDASWGIPIVLNQLSPILTNPANESVLTAVHQLANSSEPSIKAAGIRSLMLKPGNADSEFVEHALADVIANGEKLILTSANPEGLLPVRGGLDDMMRFAQKEYPNSSTIANAMGNYLNGIDMNQNISNYFKETDFAASYVFESAPAYAGLSQDLTKAMTSWSTATGTSSYSSYIREGAVRDEGLFLQLMAHAMASETSAANVAPGNYLRIQDVNEVLGRLVLDTPEKLDSFASVIGFGQLQFISQNFGDTLVVPQKIADRINQLYLGESSRFSANVDLVSGSIANLDTRGAGHFPLKVEPYFGSLSENAQRAVMHWGYVAGGNRNLSEFTISLANCYGEAKSPVVSAEIANYYLSNRQQISRSQSFGDRQFLQVIQSDLKNGVYKGQELESEIQSGIAEAGQGSSCGNSLTSLFSAAR